ncbi:PTS system IIB component, Glc family /PTS system IIC component, Glc family [Clostridium amylolyticum]|uniref:PTS system IIB component, Glc family /PTS system IIC component, Glc family n=1 Tax=Clostridium amylolyticum TaxID=1121298 RepID=A0A1M6PBS6_9CLOT|nr:PTS transporter subunit EIIC [Clostridium amylolyticum]SHK05405.1 PTS system IIB component, Glc family /PTS system IIC component, Glc family [Clostridium amylolyticum]
MKNSKYFSAFQQLGKVLMTPVMLLPIAGILVGIGSAFSSVNLIKTMPFLENHFLQLVFKIFKAAGNSVFSYLPVIFAISIAIGYAKKEKGVAALAAFLSFIVMHNVMSTLLIDLGKLNPAKLQTGQSMVLGIPSLDVGVFGGIIVGFLVAFLHNKFYNISLPPVLGIFSGTKFVPMISIVASVFLGLVMAGIWPIIQGGLTSLSAIINSTGAFGTVIYGLAERALLPFGLHHFVYLPFFFTSLGGSALIDGKTIEGAVNIYQAQLASPTAMFDINITRFVMNGKVIIAAFGLTGAAFAMYKTARPEKKKFVKGLIIAAAIPAFFTGITEPIEYAFLFVAPMLFVVHALYAGLAYLLTYLLQVNVPGTSAFGGPFLSTIFNGIMQSDKGSNWIWIPILGTAFFFLYYFTFKYMILKFDYKTPGREEDTEETQVSKKETAKDEILYEIIEGLGGQDNILSVDACFTRLRVKVKDKVLVGDTALWKKLGANGVVQVSDGVQVIYGAKADVYKTQIREAIGLD